MHTVAVNILHFYQRQRVALWKSTIGGSTPHTHMHGAVLAKWIGMSKIYSDLFICIFHVCGSRGLPKKIYYKYKYVSDWNVQIAWLGQFNQQTTNRLRHNKCYWNYLRNLFNVKHDECARLYNIIDVVLDVVERVVRRCVYARACVQGIE